MRAVACAGPGLEDVAAGGEETGGEVGGPAPGGAVLDALVVEGPWKGPEPGSPRGVRPGRIPRRVGGEVGGHAAAVHEDAPADDAPRGRVHAHEREPAVYQLSRR